MSTWTVAYQASLSMGYLRQEFWNVLPFSSLGDLSDPEIKPISPSLQSDSLLLSHQGSPTLALIYLKKHEDCIYLPVIKLATK